jgi:hypothetical protein
MVSMAVLQFRDTCGKRRNINLIIKENFENFLIHRCNYILLSQVYCVWQVVKTPTIISNNPVHLCSCLTRFFLQWETFQTEFVRNTKTYILCSKTFFLKSSRGKPFRAGQATDDNMAHAQCMADTQGYKHPLRICNTCCFPTAKMITRTRLNVTICVHCLPCHVHDGPCLFARDELNI